MEAIKCRHCGSEVDPAKLHQQAAKARTNPMHLIVLGFLLVVTAFIATYPMLEQHLDAEEIKPVLSALEALKAEPENESSYSQLVKAFDDLGPQQGAVLTYAPYVGILLSDDPFGY